MANTKIEWCDKVWNPVTGCTPVSAGCDNCYARRMANRLQNNPKAGKKYCNGFKPTEHGNELFRPAQWHPSRIFVCSMGDLFHEDIHFKFIEHILDRIMFFSQHTFMVLTKRPERMQDFFEWLPENKRKPIRVIKFRTFLNTGNREKTFLFTKSSGEKKKSFIKRKDVACLSFQCKQAGSYRYCGE